MPLSSELFKGDADLEGAANIDSAHIMQGARGPHVKKIQIALNSLDNAELDEDGIFGQATARAVLSYKTKRDIINRRYQTTADNVVGKMTMASLDKEMSALESPFQVTNRAVSRLCVQQGLTLPVIARAPHVPRELGVDIVRKAFGSNTKIA